MLKKQLRSNYRKKRELLSQNEISHNSIAIANQLLELPIWSFNYYHIFLSIKENKEVDTNAILSILLGKDKNIVVPKVDSDSSMKSFLLTDSTVLRKNSLNIPEPIDGIEVAPNKIDVVFIPLLAFDKKGNRVGYGKGFYDSFLKRCRPDIIRIGLSFFEPEDKISDINQNDIPMDYCVTPSKVYSFTAS